MIDLLDDWQDGLRAIAHALESRTLSFQASWLATRRVSEGR